MNKVTDAINQTCCGVFTGQHVSVKHKEGREHRETFKTFCPVSTTPHTGSRSAPTTIKSFMNVGPARGLGSPEAGVQILCQTCWSGDHVVQPVFQVLFCHLLPGRSFLFVLHLLFFRLLHFLTHWRLKEKMMTFQPDASF